MNNIFPKAFKEIQFPLPIDFEGSLDTNEIYLNLLAKSSHLLSKKASAFSNDVFDLSLMILATPLIGRNSDIPAGTGMIRQQIELALEKLSLEELNRLANYYGIAKSLEKDPTSQFYMTDVKDEKIFHRTLLKIILNFFLMDVEASLEKQKIYFKYAVSKIYWRELFETENEGDGSEVDYIVETILG